MIEPLSEEEVLSCGLQDVHVAALFDVELGETEEEVGQVGGGLALHDQAAGHGDAGPVHLEDVALELLDELLLLLLPWS